MSSPGEAAAQAVRPLRADAQRNRDAILRAAKAVLARDGMDAQMDDIARKAKVGVGTLYRHFPTKEALVRALMAERFEEISRNVEAALDDPDPWHGFTGALWRGAELAARDRAVSRLFGARMQELRETHAASERLNRAAAELLERARAAGALRPDVEVSDIPVLMCGVMQAMHEMSRDPEAWRRHLQIVIDGLRAGTHTTPLPSAAGDPH